MKLARCNLMSVGIFAWATLEHFQRTRGVLRLMAAVMVKGKTKVRFELSGYEEPLNRMPQQGAAEQSSGANQL
jgi:hypothetical protein